MTYQDARDILDNCTHGGRFGWQGRKNLCQACLATADRAWKQARKEQLAVLPRCEVPTCNRRGAMHAMGVLLCQAHFDRANRAHLRRASQGIGLFLAVTYSPERFLVMAQGH